MAKIVRFLRQGHKANETPVAAAEEHRKDLYESFLQGKWEEILTPDVRGEDILTAAQSAIGADDVSGAVKFLSSISSSSCYLYSQSPRLHEAWVLTFKAVFAKQADMAQVMDMFACAEKDKHFDGEKQLFNKMIDTLLSLQAPPSETRPAQRVAQWCQKQGHYSFGFDIALSSENFEEAYSILTAMQTTSPDHELMLQDVASQMKDSGRVIAFIDFCIKKGSVNFAFALALRLQQWSVIEQQVKAGLATVSLLRDALRQSVSERQWNIVRLLIGHLRLQDVHDELINNLPPHDASVLVDLLVESNYVSVAVQLACSSGMPTKAAQIVKDKDFVMDPELSVSASNACFDSHCRPEDFLGQSWDRHLLEHVLTVPKGNRFSENQWRCVTKFLNACTPKQDVLVLMQRAVEEDASCLDRFIGRGVDDDLMESLLSVDPNQDLTDNQLSCVVKLLYQEVGIDLRDSGNVLTDEVEIPPAVQLTDTNHSKQPSDTEGIRETTVSEETADKDVSLRRGQKAETGKDSVCDRPVEDWSLSVLRIDGKPVSPWWYVMKAAQTARNSKHIRQLAVRAAYEGLWNCLIQLAFEGLHQHPLDLLLSLQYDHPEILVLDYLKEEEEGIYYEYIPCYMKGWRDLRHRLDIMNLLSRDLMEERHRMILLERALATEDWHTLQALSSVDVPLPQKRAVFRKAMQKRQWFLAKDMFEQLPDPANPYVFNVAMREVTETSDVLYNWMMESGLKNPYLSPELYADLFAMLDEKEMLWKANNPPNPNPRFWDKFLPKPKYTPPAGFQRPNPAVEKEEDREKITSRQRKKVQKAARKRQWGLVMRLYEGGMGPEVKMAVLQEAIRQDKWSELTCLIRCDPEAQIFYTHSGRMILEKAVENGVWPCVEVVVEKLSCEDDRCWLFPFALGMRRWSLVLTLVQMGVSVNLREEAVWTAIERNEWTFVMDYALLTAERYPEELNPRLKKAIRRSLTRLVSVLQPSQAEKSTTFGLDLFTSTEMKACRGSVQGQNLGQDEGRGQGGSGAGAEREQVVPGTRLEEEEEEEEEEEWRSEDGSTALQVAAGLLVWKACKVLFHCGVDSNPPTTPSHPDEVILLALRHNQPDFMFKLLDRGVTIDVKNRLFAELLMRPALNISADVGVSLFRALVGEKTSGTSPLNREESSSPESAADVTDSSNVIDDVVSLPEGYETLLDEICLFLKRKEVPTFQPFVFRGIQNDFLPVPVFVYEWYFTSRNHQLEENSRDDPAVLRDLGDSSQAAGSNHLGNPARQKEDCSLCANLHEARREDDRGLRPDSSLSEANPGRTSSASDTSSSRGDVRKGCEIAADSLLPEVIPARRSGSLDSSFSGGCDCGRDDSVPEAGPRVSLRVGREKMRPPVLCSLPPPPSSPTSSGDSDYLSPPPPPRDYQLPPPLNCTSPLSSLPS